MKHSKQFAFFDNPVGHLIVLSACCALHCRYRALGLETSKPEDSEVKRVQKLQKKFDRLHLKNDMKSNVIRNLPQNVPY